MGSPLSSIRNRSQRNGNMEESDINNLSDDSSADSDQDGYSMVLAMLLNGQIYRAHDDDDGENEQEMETQDISGLQEPDTVQESDLKQTIQMNLGKLTDRDVNENIVSSLKRREINCCGIRGKRNFTPGCCTSICAKLIPNSVVNRSRFRRKVFCGTYSEDGKIFLSACQDGFLRVYHSGDLDLKHCKPFKTVAAIDIGWSILDTAFSPDALYLTYSTWSNDIYTASIYDNEDENLSSHKALDLRPGQRNFAAFSLQFSSDSNEILCGANDGHLYIYNRTCQERTSRIFAHQDDINAVCFADQSSQILYSGGDDGLVHVWDRRCLSENEPQSVGSFAGHLDGLTFIDSHQDGRYLLSNSKDQTIKLWDLRKFSSKEAQDAVMHAVSRQPWDYRWQQPPRRSRNVKKTVSGDTSIKTYHGHKVTNTLIRSRFSPLHTTGQRYIYSGCSSGNVVIYDILTGDIISKLREHTECVRDVSWHPYEPRLVSSSWDGTFGVWGYDSSVKEDTEFFSRKKRKSSKGGCDDDEETGESGHRRLRRSPRLARTGT